jgi:hypothetical protein
VQKDNVRDIIAELVARFAEQIDSYKHSGCNKTQTRREITAASDELTALQF